MTISTIVYVTLGVIAMIGILMAIWVCIAERWERKIKQRSVDSIIDKPRNIIK